jgi:dipeptidyl aminopeptidase/acylaminoacyl peptidase
MKLRSIVALGAFLVVLSALLSVPVTRATAPEPAILQLTNDQGAELRPVWSPDNRRIAYQSNRDGPFHIFLVNVDGTNQRALTKGASDDRHPVWMPDGKAILFDSFDGAKREIWSVNVADGTLKQLTRLGALANFPSPSPDGQRMTFYVFKDDALDLWAARIDGTDAKPLTRALASAQENQCTFACHQAAWSKDGQILAYSGGDHETVWTMGSDGTNPQPVIADGEHNHFPWFLADGRLAFVTEHVTPSSAWTEAWAYNLQGNQRVLLQGQMALQGPMDWSNDNTQVVFHSPRAGNFDIYLINLNAPGGLDALQGKPVPTDQMRGPTAPNAPGGALPASAPETTQGTRAQDGDLGILIWAVAIGAIGLSAVWLASWAFRRRA